MDASLNKRIFSARRDPKQDSKMDKVLEKYQVEYAAQNKTFLGIKLTDSFLNSCMDFQKLKASTWLVFG